MRRTAVRRTHGVATTAVLALLVAVPALAVSASGPSSGTPGEAAESAADQRPNVVLVVADDLGWGDLSSDRVNDGHGNALARTPAIDRLAEEGTVFDRAYASPTCSPTRTALLTGMYAPRPDNGVYLVGGLDRGGAERELVAPPQGRSDGRLVLPDDAVTVGETMRDAGYATAYAGKFHVTRFADDVVTEHGFEENWGGSRAGAVLGYHALDGQFDRTVSPSLDAFAAPYTADYVASQVAPYSVGVDPDELDALVGTPKHVTDALGDATLDVVDRHADGPFFALVSHYAVHTPVGAGQPRADLGATYAERAAEQGATGARPSYAALVEGMDQAVGRLVHQLETTPDPRNPGRPLADNTVVVVTSDNGGRTDVGASNGPLRGQKGELDEGGTRVPFIAWSGDEDLVARGVVNDSVVDSTDLYPTLADYADTEMPARATPDGDSLREAVATGARLDRPRFAHLPGYLLAKGRDQRPETVVWRDRFKLRYSYEDQRVRLYDVVADPGESEDLAGRDPARVAAMGGTLLRWLDEVDAPLATLRRGADPLRIDVRGAVYVDGEVRRFPRGTTLVVRGGEEVPFVLEQTTADAPSPAPSPEAPEVPPWTLVG